MQGMMLGVWRLGAMAALMLVPMLALCVWWQRFWRRREMPLAFSARGSHFQPFDGRDESGCNVRKATGVNPALRTGGCLLAMALCGQAHAQSDSSLTPHLEHEKRLRAAEQVGPLKSDLFGDSVSLYNGASEFAVTDIDLPGNNSLPVQLRRRFKVESFKEVEPLGGFGNWDIDVPYLHGTFDAAYKWNTSSSGSTARCSSLWYPRTSTPFEITDIWAGNHMHLPEGGGGELLYLPPSGGAVPSDGATYLWGTSSLHRLTCKPSTANGYPGEGFIAIDTSGNRYFFDVGIERSGGFMKDSSGVGRGRTKVYLMASRVEDRHGNWVAYQYTGDRLTGISSSDGRAITLTYSGNRIVKATAHGREWNYAYTSDLSALGMRRVPLLSQVTLPDSSKWGYQYGLANSGQGGLNPFYERWDGASHLCEPPPFHANSFSLEVTHPAGAKGVFDFQYTRQYRSGTPANACNRRGDGNYVLGIPDHFDLYALIRKTITGPGLPSLQWQYGYSSVGGRTTQPVPCMGCPGEKPVVVTQPDGSRHEHVFGNRYRDNSGRLLRTNIKSASGVLLRSEINTYVTDAEAASAPFPDMYGSSFSTDDGATTKIRPVKHVAIVQQDVTFSRSVNSFDAFARPSSATKSSVLPGNPSRTEVTAYHDILSKWVLGQQSKLTVNGIVASETAYNANALPTVQKSFGRTVQTLTWNADGTVATVKDGNNNTIMLSSWKRGIPQSIKYPGTPEASSGAMKTAAVNDHGWITSVTDENGFTTVYGYDAMGRLILIDYPNSDTVDWFNTTLVFEPVASTEYGIGAGHWRQTISTGNARKVSYFDALWRPLVVREYDTANVAGTQRFTRFTYDHEGRTTFASYPGTSDALTSGMWTYYDALGRPVQTTQDSELGSLTTTTEYLPGLQTRVTPPRGTASRTTTSYLAWDEPTTDFPIAIAHPAGAFTDIARDVFGKPTAITRRNSGGTITLNRSYVYDGYQQLCKSVEPETGATIMDYDGAGNLLWSKSGATQTGTGSCNTGDIPVAQRTTRTYDGRNRLTTLNFPDGRGNQSWTYTKDGLPNTISTNNSNGGDVVTNSYGYNKRRLLEAETFGVNGQLWNLAYGYTRNGHLGSHTSPGLAVDYAPDALGQPTRAGTYATAVGYFPNGGMKQFIYGNGIKHTLTQNPRGLPDTSCDFAGSSCGAGAVLNDGYDYDGHGNVMGISDGRTNHRGDRTMTYDALDRLTKTVSPMFGTADYGYNVLDNLITVKVTGGSHARDHTYVYDAENRLGNIKNTVGGATVVGLGYDVQGNLANRNGVVHIFDQGNRLREVTGVEQYRYDGHGRRVLAVRNGQNLYSVYGQDGTLRFQRDERTGKTIDYVHLNGSLVAQVENAIALSTPTLTTPGSSMTGSYTVSWTTAPVATKYQLQERLNSGSWSTIHDAAGTSKALSGKAAGVWGYQVRACSATACGSWSVEKTVTVQLPPTGVPTLTVPETALNGGFMAAWTSVSAATHYQLQERQGSGNWSSYPDASATTHSISGKAAGNWSYQVRACNAAGCGGWSTIKTVNVLYPPTVVPTLTVPATSSTGNYSASWTSVATANRYELQEQLNSGSWALIHNAAATSKAISGKATGSWGYRVRACNDAGCGAYSAMKTVAVTLPPTGVPTLTVPATNSTGSYSASWTAVAAATRYELQERSSGGSWSLIHEGSATSKAVSGKAVGIYEYQVRGCNAGGCAGYSAVKTIEVAVAPTGVPTLTAPSSSVNGNYTVSWTSVPTATRYELQRQVNGGGWALVVNKSATNQTFADIPDGTYGYRVRACNFAGCAGYSAPKTVIVQRPVPVPGMPTGINMQQMGGQRCRITWNAVAGATHYQVSLDGTIETAPGPMYIWDGLCPTSLRVAACNAYGCSGWGS
ncbi:RHS repeat protein [Pseudoxanthomonas putridarboris]|uniref:RHS repeat protein n=1 Tax=Pseudoxanthomonas putridarboris TaxID=752605 RepID=A0ABU9IZN4_9GAMM